MMNGEFGNSHNSIVGNLVVRVAFIVEKPMSVSNGTQNDPANQTEDEKPRRRWQFWVFMSLLLIDALGSGLFLACIVPG